MGHGVSGCSTFGFVLGLDFPAAVGGRRVVVVKWFAMSYRFGSEEVVQ